MNEELQKSESEERKKERVDSVEVHEQRIQCLSSCCSVTRCKVDQEKEFIKTSIDY